MPAWSAYVAPVLFVAILLAAAISDAMRRKIPNWTVLALVGLFIVAAVLKLTPTDPWWALGAAGIAFVVTYGLYHFDIIGAGDAKLFTAAALFAGMKFLPLFALLTALAGGLYAVGFVLVRPRLSLSRKKVLGLRCILASCCRLGCVSFAPRVGVGAHGVSAKGAG